MMFNITQKTSLAEIDSYIRRKIEEKEIAIISALSYVGEQCVNEARDNGRYINRTGNLRSSVGYVIAKNGFVVSGGGFTQVAQGSQGSGEGKRFIDELVDKQKKGIYLIVVAGMKYSAYVEAKSLNVLSSAELLAESLVPSILKKLGFVKR